MFNSWVGKIPWRRDRPPTPVFMGFPGGSDGKESTCHAGDLGLIPVLGRSPGGGHDNPLQYSSLGNPVEREAWQAIVHEVAKSRTRLKQLSTCTMANFVVIFYLIIPDVRALHFLLK